MMTVGSLFSGVDGLGLGFEEEGYEIIWFVEKDLYCQAILRKHWPTTPLYGDIKKVDYRTIRRPDVIIGGFPCQDISNAGKRAGITGSRSSLWKYYLKAIRTLRPRYAVIENVSALTKRGLNVVLADLAQVGYDAEWYNISASSVGAPHRRERIFIVAYTDDERCKSWNLQEQSNKRGIKTFIKSSSFSEDVADTECERLSFGVEQCKSRELGENGEKMQRKGDKQTISSAGRSKQQYVSDSNSERCEERGREESDEQAHSRIRCNWAIEPDMGGTLDGFSSQLDGNRNIFKAHKEIMAYGNATKKGTKEIMQELRKHIGTESLQWEIRGLSSIPSEAVLLTFLRKYESDFEEGKLSLESEKIQEEGMRSMRMDKKSSSSPPKQKRKRQQRRESPNSLHSLSQILARHAESAWCEYRNENATNHWESGIARVASQVPNRVDRIKCLGNAVCPPVAQVIAKAIKIYEEQKEKYLVLFP